MPDLESMKIGSAKRFRIAVVFLDIVGFSDYAENNDVEDVLFMLNLFIPEVMEIVRDFDGNFEKNTGDGILAYFGVGDSNIETANTALEYIATVKYALANCVNPELEDNDIEPIHITAGASIGTVHISRIGVNALNRRTAVGYTPNVAAKLESMAGSNEYLVNSGIRQYAVESDDEWDKLLERRGRIGGYTWGGDPDHYYNLSGGWTSTDWSNL
ncbi:adenylate/guanylate cyclase domain-containing protein [Halococcus sp. AFM35]|uniref:adenylate/guanylate cyclase domain-containing protein n=1 Tax=Halococcus sp. AFM35 TaxID=3421653 RepID=UPI003EBBE067